MTSGSPADRAGLQVGDHISQFGSITAQNFAGLNSIAEVTTIELMISETQLIMCNSLSFCSWYRTVGTSLCPCPWFGWAESGSSSWSHRSGLDRGCSDARLCRWRRSRRRWTGEIESYLKQMPCTYFSKTNINFRLYLVHR